MTSQFSLESRWHIIHACCSSRVLARNSCFVIPSLAIYLMMAVSIGRNTVEIMSGLAIKGLNLDA